MPVLEVKTIEPFAMSPKAAAAALSISKRKVSILIADGALIARKDGARTLVDFQSIKAHYESLPRVIPNAPQSVAPRRAGKAGQ